MCVCVFEGVFLVTANIWFWCSGVALRKIFRNPNFSHPCKISLRFEVCGVPMQKSRGIITFHKSSCDNIEDCLLLFLSLSQPLSAHHHNAKGWRKANQSI